MSNDLKQAGRDAQKNIGAPLSNELQYGHESNNRDELALVLTIYLLDMAREILH